MLTRTQGDAVKLIVVIGLAALFASGVGSAAADTATPLDTLIERSMHSMQVADSGLAGAGSDWIRTRARYSRFVLLGEDHGIAGMARFSTALAKTIGRVGYRYTAIETDPFIAAELERLLRSGDPDALKHYLEQDGYRFAIPIYAWAEEADFLRAALANGPADRPVLWGLDQAFIGAAYAWLEEIERLATGADAKSDAALLARDAKADSLSFLGTVDQSRLLQLESDLRAAGDVRAGKLAAALIESARIYRPFVAGGGSIYKANLARETLMKQTFLERYRDAERHDGAPPKVLFKFGAYHMTNGLSPTHVPSLASFAYEQALADDAGAVSILMVCGPGGASADLMGNVTSCDDVFARDYGFLTRYLSSTGATLIDLRPLKDRPGAWKDLNEQVKEQIWAYDAIVVISGGGASHMIVK